MWLSSHVYDDVMEFLELWTCVDVDLHGLMSCEPCGGLMMPATYLSIYLHLISYHDEYPMDMFS